MLTPRRAVRGFHAKSLAFALSARARIRPFPSDVYCPICETVFRRFLPHRGRLSVICPRCGSRSRHRLLAASAILGPDGAANAGTVLHFAPEPSISALVRSAGPRRYIRCDLEPRFDIASDITRLALRSKTVDLVLCCHVLEHVPDDSAALREIRRVLRPETGQALIQIPWNPTVATDEDAAAAPAERIARFGQVDHVRQYGNDITHRLKAAGLDVMLIDEARLDLPDNLALDAYETIFVATPTAVE